MLITTPELQSIITYCVSQAAKCPATRSPVVCFTCDPPSVKFIKSEVEVDDPYICEVCDVRQLKRIKRATNPLFGRMGHGEGIQFDEAKNIGNEF